MDGWRWMEKERETDMAEVVIGEIGAGRRDEEMERAESETDRRI